MKPLTRALLRPRSSTHLYVHSSQYPPLRRMFSHQPLWLKSILEDSSSAPRLFAWTPSNFGSESSHARVSDSELESDRRIFILGLGNLGRLFATSLAQAPDRPPITLVAHRKELLEQYMVSKGIEILRNGRSDTLRDFDIEWWTETPPGYGPVREVSNGSKIRNLLITTKAAAALPQADRVRRYLDQDSTITFAQNGMSKLWPPQGPAYISHRYKEQEAPNFLACVTTHGVTSQGPFKSHHASQADVSIGPLLIGSGSGLKIQYMIQQMTAAPHLDARSVPKTELWVLQLEKLVINSVINPLTAILGCKNGTLFTESSGVIASVINQLLAEASQVLRALINHKSTEEVLSETSSSQAHINATRAGLLERFSQENLKTLVYKVGHKVRDNTSSMLQDVRAGKSTEIRDFNGWIVETAAFLDQNLGVKGHQALVNLVESGKTLDVAQLGTSF